MANLPEGGKTAVRTMKELQDMGFSIAVKSNAAVYKEACSLKNLWVRLKRAEATKGYQHKMVLFSDFNKIVGLDKIRALEAHYLRDVFQALQPQNK
jgi:2,3-dimethylmalate lyase